MRLIPDPRRPVLFWCGAPWLVLCGLVFLFAPLLGLGLTPAGARVAPWIGIFSLLLVVGFAHPENHPAARLAGAMLGGAGIVLVGGAMLGLIDVGPSWGPVFGFFLFMVVPGAWLVATGGNVRSVHGRAKRHLFVIRGVVPLPGKLGIAWGRDGHDGPFELMVLRRRVTCMTCGGTFDLGSGTRSTCPTCASDESVVEHGVSNADAPMRDD